MTISLPTYSKLNTAALSRVFDNKSECYKLFWFQAIMSRVREGRRVMSFEELIDEMIADAWYMVSEYHLNLGPTDNLEFAVDYIHSTTDLKSSEKKELIVEEIRSSDDRVIREYKRKLIANVPYRLQSTLMPDMKGADWNCGARKLAEKINRCEHLMYYFTRIDGLNSEITIEPEWFDYLTENQVIIDGWIRYNLVTYLQRRNPNVPGIVDKLHELWDDCAREHINSDEVRQRLYRQGLSLDEFACELEKVVQPVYMAARNCGFGEWSYNG